MRLFLTKRYLILPSLALLLSSNLALAQPMEVANTAPITPLNLITNIFLGEGVEVLDVQFEGSPAAVGFFRDGDAAVGIDRGIVMSTGFAASGPGVLGVNGLGSQQSSSTTFGPSFDPDMSQIAGGNPIFDMVKYTITFVPISDTLRFRYVFASEEYPEYVCTEYNDIFGFFISGPGINGPYSNGAINIARVPGTNLPVTINNVNPGQIGSAGGNIVNCTPPRGSLAFSEYFNANYGPTQPVFDGYTDVFAAEAIVMPCSTYTIKLVICDVSDSGWDSGVFLEARSFGTGSLKVDVSTASLDGSVAEGCAAGTLAFSLPFRVESDFPIEYTIFGSAQNGVDYAFIPPDLFIPAGDSTVSVPIVAFEDGIEEGVETLIIDIQRDACNRDTIVILIRDNPLVPAELGPDVTICQGDTIPLDGTLDVPLPLPLTFYSEDTIVILPAGVTLYSDIDVAGVLPPSLGPGIIQSVCIDDLRHNWVDDMRMYLISPGGQFLELVTDIGNPGRDFLGTCFMPTAIRPIASATLADQPFTGEWQPEGLWQDLYGDNRPTNGRWRLSLYDKFTPDVGTLNRWSITFNPIYEISYQWQPADGLSCTDCPDPLAFPDTTTVYVMTAVDSYGCETTDTIVVEVVAALEAPLLNCAIVTENSITVAWPPVPGASSYEVSIDGGAWAPANGAGQHTLGSLPWSTAVSFQVRAVGPCPGLEATIECVTLDDCQPVDVAVASIVDASCHGAADGRIALSAAGTTGPFVFSLGGNSNQEGTFDGLAAGSYVVLVIDSAGCISPVPVEVGQPAALQAELVASEASCAGQADGRAALEIAGGSGPFAFNWSDGQTDSVATGLAAGLYSVEALDANGCRFDYAFEISEPEPLSLTAAVDSARCSGQADGRVLVSAVGGTPDYDYAFSAGATPGALPGEAINLAAGQYEAAVTDANGCQETLVFELGEPAALSVDIAATDARCAGQSDGSAMAVASGGNGAYSFRWENQAGETVGLAAIAENLPAGGYTLYLEDSNACTLAEIFAIAAPDSLVVQAAVQAASCAGVEDGAISLQAAGGTPGYVYTWSDIGAGGGERAGLGAGLYEVVIADANGCEQALAIEIDSPQSLALDFETIPASCFGSADGQAAVMAAGGTGDYTYLWSDGQSGPSAVGLSAGLIGVTVEDSNGCAGADSVNVEEPAVLALNLHPQEPACYGGSDGTIAALPEGGVEGYLFDWSNGQTGPVAESLPAGTHSIVVTDANGCSVFGSLQLGQPEALAGSISTQAASCLPTPDGRAALDAQGGTLPYSYRWSNGAQSATAPGLAAGSYSVTLTDANGCTLVSVAAVESIPPISLQLSTSNVSCQGGRDGRASVAASGGLGGYRFDWGSGLPDAPLVDNISSGNYNLRVTDSLGCTATASFFISQPPALAVDVAMDMVSCAGGADGRLRLLPRGGTPPYSVAWSTGPSGELLDGLAVGNYSATVTDALGCTAAVSAAVVEASPVDISLQVTGVKCFGESTGAARVLVSGGVAPYVYLWSNGAQTASLEAAPAGDYALSITDAAGCEIVEEVYIPQPAAPMSATVQVVAASCHGADDGRIELTVAGGTPGYRYSLDGKPSGSAAFIRLAPGAYRPMAEDANGCQLSLGQAIVSEPPPIAVDLGGTQSVEYGAALVMYPDIQGGQGSLTYEWFPQDSSLLSCFDCLNPEVWPPFQVGLRLVVTDAKGCKGEGFANVYARKDRPILVPTGFTPNGDGNNDRLLVHARQGVELRILYFRVFDRWGELLFEAADFAPNDPAIGWDGDFRGSPVQPGVFIWEAVVEYPDQERQSFQGNTTLIR